MSELADQVDKEIGNDTEQSRINFLKYLNYGRQMATDALIADGVFPREVVLNMVKDAIHANSANIFAELETLDQRVGEAQSAVEKTDEDEELESIKRQSDITNPAIAKILSSFEQLLKLVDEKHTAIIRDVRTAGLAEIKAKYVG